MPDTHVAFTMLAKATGVASSAIYMGGGSMLLSAYRGRTIYWTGLWHGQCWPGWQGSIFSHCLLCAVTEPLQALAPGTLQPETHST